ncbi:hypothetical protein [Streptomyces sp. NPDC004042]|uniref:hypothetical protein n=1 Tax=Streptomyces sp. NPDC004042 TaxID=3154451 RepID=UPI0033A6EC0F
MTLDETIDLLSQIALIDDRVVKVDEAEQRAQVTMWAAVLRDVPLAFAGEAVGRHYAESAWPVMPKDIVERWKIPARDRMSRHIELGINDDLPSDDPTTYRARLAARRRAVFVGQQGPAVKALPPAAPAGRQGSPPNEAYRAARAAARAAREAAAQEKAGAAS